MKSLISTLMIFLIINIAQAKNIDGVAKYKWGYINTKGEMVIKPQFEEIDLYGFASNGMSAFKQGEKWGYINTKGEIVIKPQFDEAYQFSSYGLAQIETNCHDSHDENENLLEHGQYCKSGYIDANGNIVIKPQFEKSRNFQSNGLAVFEKYYRVSEYGFNTSSGLIDSLGNVIVEPIFHNISNFNTEQLCIVTQKTTMRNGIMDSKGKILFWLPKNFSFAGSTDEIFDSNGLAKVQRSDGTGNYDTMCYVNKTGVLVGCKMQSIEFQDGNKIGKFQKNEKWGYIDASGKVIIKPKFDEVEHFDKYGMALVKHGNGWRYINKTGDFAIKESFESAVDFYNDELAPVKKNNLWGYINRQGEMIIEPKFDDANAFNLDSGLTRVIKNGKLGYIDKNGTMVISTKIESSDCCDNNHFLTKYIASFEENNKIGIMDNKGRIIIPAILSDAKVIMYKDIKLIIIRYSKDGKYAYLNEKGKMIIKPIYDYIANEGNPYLSPFSDEGIAMVRKNNLYGYIDINGDIIAKPQFKNASEFKNGFAAVLSKE
ncbi:MAG: WG repeat-containing protein [Sulfurovaceae bacterium]|nr:WG repeat-containing protein [Sulfurovaceae bacterium]MDD5548160.1 WG repeat-containing protein [Sulfurovaceae bacterium]